jgi:hypothetical protein
MWAGETAVRWAVPIARRTSARWAVTTVACSGLKKADPTAVLIALMKILIGFLLDFVMALLLYMNLFLG